MVEGHEKVALSTSSADPRNSLERRKETRGSDRGQEEARKKRRSQDESRKDREGPESPKSLQTVARASRTNPRKTPGIQGRRKSIENRGLKLKFRHKITKTRFIFIPNFIFYASKSCYKAAMARNRGFGHPRDPFSRDPSGTAGQFFQKIGKI